MAVVLVSVLLLETLLTGSPESCALTVAERVNSSAKILAQQVGRVFYVPLLLKVPVACRQHLGGVTARGVTVVVESETERRQGRQL